jgi:hypothetical protein
MVFQPGESGNPSGRKPGAKNKRTQEILDLLQERGDKDPLDFLSEVISSNGTFPAELKTTAANYLAPYLHSKYGTKIPPRYILEPVALPHPEPTTLDQTNANINYITAGIASGQIDLDFGQSLMAGQHTVANHIIAEEELKLKFANSPHAATRLMLFRHHVRKTSWRKKHQLRPRTKPHDFFFRM